MPLRNRYLFVCTNRRPEGSPKGSCAERGAEEVHAALKAALFQRGLAKVATRVCTSSCLDFCASGPTILVEPDHVVLGHITLADVPELVDALERGEIPARMRLSPDDLARG